LYRHSTLCLYQTMYNSFSAEK